MSILSLLLWQTTLLKYNLDLSANVLKQLNWIAEGLGSRDGSYGHGSIDDVRVTDCAESPCKLRKGSEATIEFDFKPDKTYEKLTTSVFGGIGIVRVPFREVHGMDACKDIKRKSDGKKGCPIQPNEVYTYSNSFPILKSYPAVRQILE